MRVLASELAALIPGSRIAGNGEAEIGSVGYDSRRVRRGSLFAALRGQSADGHGFLLQAVEAGASALLVEEAPDSLSRHAAVIYVPDTRKAMAVASAAVYGYPSQAFRVFAVTGTNGKTSTAHLIDSCCRAAGRKSGVLGTLGARIGDSWMALAHTTPESADLQDVFDRMRRAEVETVSMEASSHAIAQSRMDCTDVDVAVFTNLTQDHLDFHGSMEAYFEVKAELFTRFAEGKEDSFLSVINVDDPAGREKLLPIARGRQVTFGVAPDALYHASDPRSGRSGTCFTLRCPEGTAKVGLALGGMFNVHNALAAASACLASGLPFDSVINGLESVRSVPGRFELVDCGQPFAVVVDYAHTPDGLENVLTSARGLTEGRLIAVFGCGGDRDRTKRPLMGGIAARLSDVPVLTSDNPRSEDPEAIARDILEGVAAGDRARVVIELDRRLAIREACALAEPGDIVVVAGKGHETYQIFSDRTIDFDDRAVVRDVLRELHLCQPGRQIA